MRVRIGEVAFVWAAVLSACTSSHPIDEARAAGDASTRGGGMEDAASAGGSAASADAAHAGGGTAAVGGSPNTGGRAGHAGGTDAGGPCALRRNGASDAGVGGTSTGGARTGGAANVEAGTSVEAGADVGVGGAPIVLECLGGGYSCDAGEVTYWRVGAVVPDGKGDPCKTVVHQCSTCCVTESNGRPDVHVTDPESLCRP